MIIKKSKSNGMGPGQELSGPLKTSIMENLFLTGMTGDGLLRFQVRSSWDQSGLVGQTGFMEAA
jgi:hypothetical protein